MSEPAHAQRRWWWAAAGLAAVVAFAVLAGRFWHPYYGFTKFVQLDEADARSGIHEVREQPVFAYAGFNGYDGAAYTQIAFHPLLDSAELKPALGNVPYRARRILGSALAWLIAGGNPARIANTYAALNLGVWLVLAAVLWRVLPVLDAPSFIAWLGVIFSAGSLHSVRLALTDLLAATLVVGAIALGERQRSRGALAALAAAGLARETALAAVVGLWRGPWRELRPWLTNLMRAVLVALPLFAWIAYVHWKAGPAAQGFGNFTWPIVGWIEKWGATIGDFSRQPAFRWLNTTTLLAVLALTVQAVYFLRRGGRSPRVENPWWRVGLSGVAMMALLGTSVWEGHPGAATRVLLPMSVAFAVLAVRERASIGWILAGSLTAFSGVLALWHVPHDPREVAAGCADSGAYVARIESGWFGVERDRGRAWAWAAQKGVITIATTVARGERKAHIALRAISPRVVEILVDDKTLWRGEVKEALTRADVMLPVNQGREVTLIFRSDDAPRPENSHPDARALGFAVYGLQLE